MVSDKIDVNKGERQIVKQAWEMGMKEKKEGEGKEGEEGTEENRRRGRRTKVRKRGKQRKG